MNVMAELDRLTAPACSAGEVRVLSPAEIAEAEARGEVTPLEQIPAQRYQPKVHYGWVR